VTTRPAEISVHRMPNSFEMGMSSAHLGHSGQSWPIGGSRRFAIDGHVHALACNVTIVH